MLYRWRINAGDGYMNPNPPSNANLTKSLVMVGALYVGIGAFIMSAMRNMDKRTRS